MHLRGQQIPQLAVVEAQWLELQEAEVLDTDWATTGISFLKGVQLLVHPIPPPAHHHLRTAGTGTAATKGTDAVILTHSQIAASAVTSDLSFQGEVRKEGVVVAMIGIEGVEVVREDEEEVEKEEEDETWMIQLLERRGKVAVLVWISTIPTEKLRSRAEQPVSKNSFAQSLWFSPSMPWTCLMEHKRALVGRTAPLWEHVRTSPSTT